MEYFKYENNKSAAIANVSIDTSKSGTAAVNYSTRGFTFNSDGITFESGNMIYNNSLYTSWDNRCVPKVIYGVKR